MKIRIDGKQVDVLDEHCWHRKCLRVAQWKGSMAKGRGIDVAPEHEWRWICMRREDYGCPDDGLAAHEEA